MLAVTNRVPVEAGDSLLCPAGTPHAIGAGILLVELQEPTDWSILLQWRGFPLGPDDATLGSTGPSARCCRRRPIRSSWPSGSAPAAACPPGTACWS